MLVPVVPEAVVVVLPDPVLVPELNLLLMKFNAACPYSVPCPWCVAALFPLQQYGSEASQ
jgi:hypothetical protein